MSFDEIFLSYRESINKRLDELSAVPDVPQKSVYTAMRYSLLAGGKRIRPVLTMATAKMLGGSLEAAKEVGCAIECIHTYSLIHDDLPCMDDDDLRRGMPTCHKKFGETTALLAGDGLLNTAAEILTSDSISKYIAPKTQLKVTNLILSASGTKGMIGGQVMDLEYEKRKDVTTAELDNMHAGKTGALIRCSVVAGGILSGFDEFSQEILKIDEFSSKLGLAFQIKDDILDCVSDEKTLGKQIGSDEKNGKNTFVTLLGMEGAEKRLNQLTEEAISAISVFGDKAKFLVEFSNYLLDRKN